MKKAKRNLSLLLSILIAMIMLLSVYFIASETNHHCTGCDCPVCEEVHSCIQTLHNIETGLFIMVSVFLIHHFCLSQKRFFTSFSVSDTLVSLKVKLSD